MRELEGLESPSVSVLEPLRNVLVLRGERPAAVLRGDWEPPGAVLVAYEPSWRTSLLRLVRVALRDVPVLVLVTPELSVDRAFGRWLRRVPEVSVAGLRYDTPWIRDWGPLQVSENSGPGLRDFAYAAGERPLDDAAPQQLGALLGQPVEAVPIALEGGGVSSNGRGFCAMTGDTLEQVGLIAEDPSVLDTFLRRLGCLVVARLPALPGEPTGHADVFVQFLDWDLAAILTPGRGANAELRQVLREGKEALLAAAAQSGVTLRLVELPLHVSGDRFYSYVNGLRTAGHFFVPVYRGAPRAVERTALKRLRRALPGVRLVPIEADLMVSEGGAVHCITLGLSVPASARLAEARRARLALAAHGQRQRRFARPARGRLP